ncbi:TetR-like C-terminal domain-containing protein [Pseudonocardia sp. ICBG1293]|uniref:TetR-like C-terminal domain-containing protein n=1 Tax=Pseudonocardia sp. ICBG1293 TaxID=2844382 RepID=UPI001CCD90D1|nr:TetR/AcrR family transcriptional regulator [Pseudonocardia sp. ICBG1293]
MPRPRDERVSAAVLAAVRDLMAENSYTRLTLQGVADRAGTTTPAVRRRWPSLRHLVVDALAEERAGVVEPDTGCVACDLTAHVEALGAALGDADTGRVLPALVADLADDPELRSRFLERFWQPRREACLVSLRAAVERGEVRRDVDPELVIDAVAGPLVLRHLFGHAPLGGGLAPQLVDLLLAGLATGGGAGHPSACRAGHGRAAP